MSFIRYLLDEHVDSTLRAQLLRHEPDLVVWMIGDPGAPKRGTLDPDLLLWCEANDFVLVTNNRKSMPVHLQDHLAAGHHVPGILRGYPEITRQGSALPPFTLRQAQGEWVGYGNR